MQGGASIISAPTLRNVTELREALLSRAPQWALCGSVPEQAAREESRRPAEYALEQRYCQLNPRGRLGIIVVDLDHHHGPDTLDAPPPTYSILNPASGHQQAGYVLADPVARSGRARRDIIQLADDVTRHLTRQLQGDPQFVGLLSRGPFHPEHVTRLIGGRLWTLRDLLQYLPPVPTTLTRREAAVALDGSAVEGRNCAAFEALRHVAYRLRAQGVTGQQLVAQVQAAGDDLNREVFSHHAAGPLSPRELAGIAGSICRWTHSHYRSPTGSARSRIHSRDRDELEPEEARAQIRAGQAAGAATRREATRAEIRAAVVTLTSQGQPVTAKTLMLVTGLSKRTVFNHSDVWN